MVYLNDHSNGYNDMGPFNGNTKIVAVIALTVAGVFVFLGLVLSLIRAMQQRAAERVCLLGGLYCTSDYVSAAPLHIDTSARCNQSFTAGPGSSYTAEDGTGHYGARKPGVQRAAQQQLQSALAGSWA